MRKKILPLLLLILFPVLLTACSAREQDESVQPTVVQFVTDGSKVSSVVNKTVETCPSTEKEGYVLEGWYKDEKYQTGRVSFPFRAETSCKLYAKWIDKRVGNDELVFSDLEDGTLTVSACDTTCPTVWIPDEKYGKTTLSNYANREYVELVREWYLPRWKKFLDPEGKKFPIKHIKRSKEKTVSCTVASKRMKYPGNKFNQYITERPVY